MKQYECYTWEFHGQELTDKYGDINLWAEVWNEKEHAYCQGFYAGNGNYKIRFYPRTVGGYQYRISGLWEQEGEVFCTPSDKNGMVITEGTHFKYENGKDYCPIGTTVYALCYQPLERIQETMDTLRNSPFNKIRMCVFPKYFDYNWEEPSIFPFEKKEDGNWDMGRPCLTFWNLLEEVISQLGELGIQCDLILLHPYDKWGFSTLSEAQVVQYFRYVVSRLAAFPNVWWSLANEYDIMGYSLDQWQQFMELLNKEDCFHHMLSNHNMIIPWDFSQKEITHSCIQLKNVDDVSRIVSQFGKPLMVDECCYEGDIPFEWGNISGFELVNRFWKVYVQGAYASHGETFCDENDVLWWSKGGCLKGESVKRIGFLKEVLESVPGPLTYYGHDMSEKEVEYLMNHPLPGMENSPFVNLAGRLSWDQIYRILLDAKQWIGHCGEFVFLVYYGNHCVATGELTLPEDKKYIVEVIDVWNMTRKVVGDGFSGNVKIALPGKEGIAVFAHVV